MNPSQFEQLKALLVKFFSEESKEKEHQQDADACDCNDCATVKPLPRKTRDVHIFFHDAETKHDPKTGQFTSGGGSSSGSGKSTSGNEKKKPDFNGGMKNKSNSRGMSESHEAAEKSGFKHSSSNEHGRYYSYKHSDPKKGTITTSRPGFGSGMQQWSHTVPEEGKSLPKTVKSGKSHEELSEYLKSLK